jgi:hypothetical protein
MRRPPVGLKGTGGPDARPKRPTRSTPPDRPLIVSDSVGAESRLRPPVPTPRGEVPRMVLGGVRLVIPLRAAPTQGDRRCGISPRSAASALVSQAAVAAASHLQSKSKVREDIPQEGSAEAERVDFACLPVRRPAGFVRPSHRSRQEPAP